MSDTSTASAVPRRATDGGWLHTTVTKLVLGSDLKWDPVAGGRLLMLVSGLISVLTTPLMQPDQSSWRVLAVVTAAMIALLVGSYLVPWHLLPRTATLGFPVSVWLALATLGLCADGLGSNFTGLITLSFGYIGLTQTAGTSVTALIPAVTAYLAAYDGWSRALFGRLPIAVTVWVILAVVLAELTQRQAVLTDRLTTAAHTDVLTGVGNRRDLERRLSSAQPGDTLAMCDLDNFKRLNDDEGHAAGDRVLSHFGLVLLACLRKNDYVARYGGEEFALLLPATDMAEAAAMLARLRARWSSSQDGVTFSAGIAQCRRGRTARETLEEADRALYSAKLAGRNRDHDESAIERFGSGHFAQVLSATPTGSGQRENRKSAPPHRTGADQPAKL